MYRQVLPCSLHAQHSLAGGQYDGYISGGSPPDRMEGEEMEVASSNQSGHLFATEQWDPYPTEASRRGWDGLSFCIPRGPTSLPLSLVCYYLIMTSLRTDP